MSQAGKTSEDVLKQMATGADSIRAAAADLARRVVAFEKWLNGLPGKTRTEHVLFNGPNTQEECLSFEPDGKVWSLYLYTREDAQDEGWYINDRRLLRDASIEDKANAIGAFPDLLTEMVRQQNTRVDTAKRAAQSFDEFAKMLGIKEAQ